MDDRKAQSELWLGGDKIFTATVKDHDLKVQYEPEWGEWVNSKEYPELTTIFNEIKQKLLASPPKSSTKGKGKGKVGKQGGPH